jgi:hypothetical protein
MAFDSRHSPTETWRAPHVWATAPPKSPTQGAISSFLGEEYTPSSPPSYRARPRSFAMLMNPFSSFTTGTGNTHQSSPTASAPSSSPPQPPTPALHLDEEPRKAHPTLNQVIHNESAPPYTLSSFMAYLSSMHSLESLEFLLDAARYRVMYDQAFVASGHPVHLSHPENDRVKTIWIRLIESYVRPGGSREVNLPGEIRDSLLRAPAQYTPPSPELLDASVSHIYDLMRDSVLSSFIAYCDASANASNQSSNKSDVSSSRSLWSKPGPRLNRANSSSSGTSSRSSFAEVQSQSPGTSVSSTSQPISIPYPVAPHHRNPFPPSSAARSVSGFFPQFASTTLDQSQLDAWLEASGSDDMSDIEEGGVVERNSSSGRASPMTPPLTPPPQGEGSPIKDGGIWSRKVKEKFRRRKN